MLRHRLAAATVVVAGLGFTAALTVATEAPPAELTLSTASTPTCQGDCVPRRLLVREQRRSRRRLLGWRRAEKRAWDLHRTLMHRPDVIEAIKLASVVYHVSQSWMVSRGSCESTGGHGHNPNARNPRSSASGEFQFLLSTWRSTPFRAFSVFSPYANAFAAGWMMGPAHRSGEWDCR